jgi:AraC family transcriptional regulator
MIITELPSPSFSEIDVQPGLQNEVICSTTRAKYQYPNHTTPYLLIANFNDTGNYLINSRYVSVDDKVFYFLNAGDKLEICFKNQMPLKTLLILFRDAFIRNWINYKHTSVDSLLDNGAAAPADNWDIPNVPFEYTPTIVKQLSRITASTQRADMDSGLFELLESFWGLTETVGQRFDQIQAKRKSTKEEIYTRLLTAKIFMHDSFSSSPTIDEIASVACLDKFHFLKLFKISFGITPHQYLVKLKLEHAYDLLATGRFTVLEACNQVGFESQGTFSNLFKRHYRLLPSEVSKH